MWPKAGDLFSRLFLKLRMAISQTLSTLDVISTGNFSFVCHLPYYMLTIFVTRYDADAGWLWTFHSRVWNVDKSHGKRFCYHGFCSIKSFQNFFASDKPHELSEKQANWIFGRLCWLEDLIILTNGPALTGEIPSPTRLLGIPD